MGSPLGPTLANVFMCHFENIGWKTALPISNQLFTEDSLMIHFYIFEQKIMLKSLEIISTSNIKTKFTSEIEENGSLSFLDITITRENNKFVTSVYRKPTFSGIFTNFESFVPEMHKRGLIETLLHRIFRLCSSYENFHREIETLKSIFKHNNYP